MVVVVTAAAVVVVAGAVWQEPRMRPPGKLRKALPLSSLVGVTIEDFIPLFLGIVLFAVGSGGRGRGGKNGGGGRGRR